MATRPAMPWRNYLTTLTRLRAPQRGSLTAIPRMVEQDPRVKHEFLIPEAAKKSVILKQFDSNHDLKKAFPMYSKGYLVLKGEGAWDEKPFLVFGKFLLRENCQCPKCVHPDTRQRTVDTFSIPEDIDVTDIESRPTDVKIGWSDGHESLYSWDWLVAHQNTKPWNDKPWNARRKEHLQLRTKHVDMHDARDTKYPEVSYEQVMSEEKGVLRWLRKIYSNGFCFIKGVPVNPEATKELIERIAFIRNTHYGGFWDFTADLTFKDTAYTNEFLGGHTDNTYFTDPARLQLFHLLSHTDGSGGESLLVDALAAARKLEEESFEDYLCLATERHSWHASGNEDVCIQPSFRAPVLSIHPDFERVYQVRWNNYDRAPKNDWKIKDQTRWYKAARRFNEILNEESRQIWTQLEPGTALIFDNWRMLHGRSEFTGKRRMCGGYVNNDDFISRLRLLKYGRERVLNNLGTTMAKRHPNSNISAIY
ncbi:Trimethyllysine dioxygenase [Penicillium frequentans]|uniref:Trimethyllysine dioxygenase n=1 Tax=Penicillium frequentans TaxID=3151616 RepID=A0AAD6CK89_9EURO|nr:Trimethyllysine dioxygenase [Penicillium glabrum]